jgi:hypothetical protein
MLSTLGGDVASSVEVVTSDLAAATAQEQQVAASPSSISANPGQAVSFSVTYTTSTGDATLTGLGLRLHYNSAVLTFNALSSVLATPTQNQSPANDTNNYDGDTNTDKYVFVSWADMSGAWPGSVPVTLYTASFTAVASATGSSSVRFTASSTASGYSLSSTPATINFVTPSTIVGRYLFYNNSSFDGNNSAANASDDNAIATDKTALLADQKATFANYSSYSRGINGLMIDFDNLTGTPTASDFRFAVGNSSTPASWTTLSTSPTVAVRTNVGSEAVDRVSLVWADGTISGTWLQVTVLATARTGLTASSVFYFGNAPGESGDSASNAMVAGSDYTATRSRALTATASADITNVYDFNRDGSITTGDVSIVRAKMGHLAATLKLITPTSTTTSTDASIPTAVSAVATDSMVAAVESNSENETATTAEVVPEVAGETAVATDDSARPVATVPDADNAAAIDAALVTVPVERVDAPAAADAPLPATTAARITSDETTETVGGEAEATNTLRGVAARATTDLACQLYHRQASLFAQDALFDDWTDEMFLAS